MPELDRAAEWLEADGLGGFASGTVGGARTRRYHALLLAATTPPTGRLVLVNGVEVWVEHGGRRVALSTQRYNPDVTFPEGQDSLAAFTADPWPRWTWRLEDGLEVDLEILSAHGAPATLLAWSARHATGPVALEVRPLVSGRDYHAMHHENPAFRFEAPATDLKDGVLVRWQPYPDVPAVLASASGAWEAGPLWFRNFRYDAEAARGLDFAEDLASPGTFRFDLEDAEGLLLLAADLPGAADWLDLPAVRPAARRLRSAEARRRAAFPTRLHRAGDTYVVARGAGDTVVAGYPWFTDWGRDTFIALRGLCLATGRLEEARQILVEWAGAVSEGMLPNRFADRGEAPEFNSVDASLWYVVAVHEYLAAVAALGKRITARDRAALEEAVVAILHGYRDGTRYRIGADPDGLLSAGQPGVQLTWMDAKVGDWVVTPRIGKPVEVQALWINALRIGAGFDPALEALADRAEAAFAERFWYEAGGYLYDVVDVNHEPGTMDATFRPNQILAVGGLPFPLLAGDRARRVVDEVHRRLYTPLGLRSLDPADPGYRPVYRGGVLERDGAYHQGTVWPWLLGPFVEAWVKVQPGRAASARTEARRRFFDPLLAHLDRAGLGHVSEVADGDAPHVPGGCPFQAWSVGEALRLDLDVLRGAARRPAPRRPPARSRRA